VRTASGESFSEAAAAALLAGATRRRVALAERGVEIAVLDWPQQDAPAVGFSPLALLHHANGFCAATWALLVRRLQRHYRVVALDARGHGDSTAPPPGEAYAWTEFVDDLIALAERLVAEQGGEPVALGMGNSFGGLVTAYAATQRPELFARVAMLDPVLHPPPHVVEELLAALPGEARESFASRGNPLAAAARKRRQVFPSREAAFDGWRAKAMFAPFEPGALDLYVAEGLRERRDGQVELKCSGEVEASVFDATGILDLYAQAPRLVAPTLLLRAGRGHFPKASFEALAERIPNVEYLDLDAGHLMPMTDAELTVDTVLAFAERSAHFRQT